MLIGTRILHLRTGGDRIDIPVQLFAPQRGEDGGWFCLYTIGWPDDEREAEGWGVDAFQALHLTLERIGLDLYTSPYHAAGELIWEEPGAGYGFPVPPNMQGELIGGDRHLSGG